MPGATCERGKHYGSLWLCCFVVNSGTLEEVVIMSSQKNTFQKSKFLFFLLIGLFLSVCLALLLNSISLPSWMRPLVPLFLIALVALLILVEALKEDTPSSTERRKFFHSFVVPAGWRLL